MRTPLLTTTLLAALLSSATFAETPQSESWTAPNGARAQVSAATSISKNAWRASIR